MGHFARPDRRSRVLRRAIRGLGSGPLSRPELRRLLCDSAITRLVTDGPSQVVDVGRATRSWPVPTRKAIAARDRGCRWPGCDRLVAWSDVHHVTWWEHGGRTDMANGVLLCGHPRGHAARARAPG